MKNSEQPINPIDGSHQEIHPEMIIGLTKREYFAGLAMQGLLSNFVAHGHYGNTTDYPIVSEIAVRCADELLKQLEQ